MTDFNIELMDLLRFNEWLRLQGISPYEWAVFDLQEKSDLLHNYNAQLGEQDHGN